MSCRYRCMSRKQRRCPHHFDRFGKSQAFLGNIFFQSFQPGESSMSLIAMVSRSFDTQFSQGLNTSTPEQKFLFQAVFPISAIQMVGDTPVFGQVIFEIGIQQIELYPADIDPPDPGIYIPSREYQTDGFPITFLVTYRGYGDLHKILSFVFGFLITHSR